MNETMDRIDVHHHFLPPIFIEAVKAKGLDRVAGAPLPQWTPERSLSVMDANGIATAVVSVGSPGVYFGDSGEAIELARACNEYGQELKRNHPGRFGYFAQLPMPLGEESVREAIHALERLGADGIGLLASTRGKFLGDPDFEPLMAELDRRCATVFVHPDIHPSTEQIGLSTPGFFIEFLVDTSRAATNLVLSGTLERYPNIRWILAHAGGFVPYIAWRLSLANMMPETNKHIPAGMLAYLQRLYFDTALSPSVFAMAALTQLVDASHILFASDFPYAPDPLVSHQIRELDGLGCFSNEDLRGIHRDNALSLIPSLARAGESVKAAATYSRADWGTRARLVRQRAISRVLEHMRNR